MTDAPTIRARWQDGAFRPVGNWPVAWCHDHLEEGEAVTLDIAKDRSMKSHRHQFAAIREAFDNLPEHLHHMPYAASPEHLRKHGLIVAGYRDVTTIDAGSKAAAERVAAMAKAFADKAHGYSIVQVRGPVVTVWTPQSQSVRAMGGDEFKRSKQMVLDWIAQETGVRVEDAA